MRGFLHHGSSRRSRALRGLLALCGAVLAQPLLSAEAAAQGAPWIAVVVETGGGAKAAKDLRRELRRQFGDRLAAPSEEAARGVPPAAMLTVTVGSTETSSAATAGTDAQRKPAKAAPKRETKPEMVVTALYWDRAGRTDALSAVASGDKGLQQAMALGLASALLRRHMASLDAPATDGAHAGQPELYSLPNNAWMDPGTAARAISLALRQLGFSRRRTFELSLSDF